MKNKNLLSWGMRALGVGVLALSFVAVLNENVRSAVRDKFLPDYRAVLSTTHGDLLGNQDPVQAVKVKTQEGLFIEVYGNIESGHQPLIARLPLHDTRDAYFVFNKQPTNLAIDDVDGDGKLEILAPSFDENLAAHLTIFKYNDQSKSFDRVTE